MSEDTTVIKPLLVPFNQSEFAITGWVEAYDKFRIALEKIANRDETCEGDCNILHEIAREALKDSV